MENYMKLELAALGENEGFARNAVAAFALCLNPSLSELSDIKTAVSEAVTNCIVHAYAGEEKGSVWIECRVEPSQEGGGRCRAEGPFSTGWHGSTKCEKRELQAQCDPFFRGEPWLL